MFRIAGIATWSLLVVALGAAAAVYAEHPAITRAESAVESKNVDPVRDIAPLLDALKRSKDVDEKRELVDAISDAVGGPSQRRPLPAAPLHAWRILQRGAISLTGHSLPRFSRVELFLGDRVFDISRARRDLGYDPKTELRESVARTALWFRERGLLPAPHGRPGYIRAPWTKH